MKENLKKNAERYQKSKKGKATKKAWKKKNRDKVKRWKLEWAKSNNGRKQARRYYRKNPMAMYGLYERSAKKRGIPFKIGKELFLKMIIKACDYCGYKPIPPNRIGLDRVDNTIGYEKKNLVPCCFDCNQMKGKRTVEEFIDNCVNILEHRGVI